MHIVAAQSWEKITREELKELSKEITSSNSKNGCMHFVYTTYNYSRKGQPVSKMHARQCIHNDTRVTDVEGVGLDFTNSHLSIHVDSINKVLDVGYNHSYSEQSIQSSETINKLLESTDLVKIKRIEKKVRFIEVVNADQSGVEKYQIELQKNYLIEKLIIFYAESEQKLYGNQSTYSKPIIEVEFNRSDGSDLSRMTDVTFFLKEGRSELLPSSNYPDYTVEDNRVIIE